MLGWLATEFKINIADAYSVYERIKYRTAQRTKSVG
ncbi:MAG: hypothetical protein QOI39_2111, partial [Mycobacterium sp.]|jgi:hypothetical protein|nr:hypothetical protein [Mycobacterium sp.]